MKSLLALVFILLADAAPGLSADSEIVFIVNAENPASSVSVGELNDYFFKRVRKWPDGTSVRFIDRTSNSPERQVFLRTVLKKSAEDINIYWIGQKLYTGDSAPLQASSKGMTIQFVSSFKGAIGFIAAPPNLEGRAVKVIQVKSGKE